MKVVAVAPAAADPAGRDVLEALSAQHWQATVAVPDRRHLPGHAEPVTAIAGEKGGIRIVPIPVRGRERAKREARWSMKAIRRLLTDVRPDLVHVESEPTSRLTALVTGVSDGLGIASTAVSWQSLPRKHSWRARSNRTRTLGHVSGIIAGTEPAADLIRAIRPDLPVAVIPEPARGIPATVPDRPAQRLALGFAARLVLERGLDLVFHACTGLPHRWTLTVIGTGPAQERLERVAERLGIASRVIWRGGLPPAARRDLWQDIDCLIVPSRRTARWIETKTPALLEAMSHGVAIIGSDTGALPMIIGEAGMVVPEGDVAALRGAIDAMADPARRRAAGLAARARVIQRFTPASIARETAVFWARVAARR